MARQGRLHVPHGTYFVVDRFQPGLEALAASPHLQHSPEDLRRIEASRQRFEALLRYLVRRWCAQVHAYCWLPQSALLILRIGEPPLEDIMHTLRGLHSKFLRWRGGRSGTPYAGRYAARLIDPDDYLLDVARHIFWSPVRAGLSRTALGYELSSVRMGLGEPDRARLCDTTIREALRLRGQLSRHGLERFLTAAPTPGFLRLLAHGSRLDRRILGSSAFVRAVRHTSTRRLTVPSRDAMVSWSARRLSIDASEITGHSRRARFVEGRALVAWLATCSATASLSEVARWFKCDPSTLHRAVDRYSAAHPSLFSEQTVAEFKTALASGETSDRRAIPDSTALPDSDPHH